jgi:hypothetical protein
LLDALRELVHELVGGDLQRDPVALVWALDGESDYLMVPSTLASRLLTVSAASRLRPWSSSEVPLIALLGMGVLLIESPAHVVRAWA